MGDVVPRRSTRVVGCLLALLWLGAAPLSPQGTQLPDAAGVIRRALDAGAYAEAEARAAEWQSRVEAQFGAESIEAAAASDALVEARLKNGKAVDPATLSLAERTLRVKEAWLGPRRVELVVSLRNLGNLREQSGDLGAAQALHERALAIVLESTPVDAGAAGDTLDDLARVLVGLGRYTDARRRIDEAMGFRARAGPTPSVATARTLEVLGFLHRQAGRYREAIEPLSDALAIRGRLAPEHPDTAATLQLQGDVLFLLGDVRTARDVWSRGFALAERTLGPTHAVIPEMLRRLGLAEFSLGDLAAARRRREAALRIGEATLPRCSPNRVSLQIALAVSLQGDGAYSDARRLYQQALTVVASCSRTGGSAAMTDVHATTLFNAAGLAKDLGELEEADRLLNSAVEVWSKGLRPDHPFVARGLDELAEVAALRGQLERARQLYERVLASRRRDLGPEHPQVAWTLTSLARTSAALGRVSVARRHLDEALAIYKKSGESDEPDHVPRLLELRGSLLARGGDLAAARASFAEALEARERIFGRGHPAVAESRLALATVDFDRGAFESASGLTLEAERVGREHLQFTARYLPERQALTYAARRPRGLDLALSMVGVAPDVDRASLLDASILSRGVVLDEFVARTRSLVSVDAETAAFHAAARGARQRFANLVVRSLTEAVPRSLIDQAREEKEEAERTLAEHSAVARAELAQADVGLSAVRGALPSGSALVSFVRYGRRPAITGEPLPGAPRRPAAAYIAFVVAGSQPVQAVPLGDAARIDTLVRRWRSAIASEGPRAAPLRDTALPSRAIGEELRRLVWDPVAMPVRGVRQVFLVPDGSLDLLPFAALPVGRNRYLLEDAPQIHYLSAERDLVVPSLAAGSGPGGLLALGDPAFDDGLAFGAGVAANRTAPQPWDSATAAARGTPCAAMQQLRFRPLDGARVETQEIAGLWRVAEGAGLESARVLVGREASERAFKDEAPKHRFLHLATHGFFFGDECPAVAPGTRAVGGVVVAARRTTRTEPVKQNPLQLSGLALAGANRRGLARADDEDGILTAEEVAALDLAGVEWAVLSACDTGVGEVRAGEGVFGLRRAFQVAGARTIIMSLWSVDDRAARAWMRALYEDRFQKGLSTADAVHAASVAMLEARRRDGQSTHPFYWAAFVAAGDWR